MRIKFVIDGWPILAIVPKTRRYPISTLVKKSDLPPALRRLFKKPALITGVGREGSEIVVHLA